MTKVISQQPRYQIKKINITYSRGEGENHPRGTRPATLGSAGEGVTSPPLRPTSDGKGGSTALEHRYQKFINLEGEYAEKYSGKNEVALLYQSENISPHPRKPNFDSNGSNANRSSYCTGNMATSDGARIPCLTEDHTAPLGA
jgi:hypothetical protein